MAGPLASLRILLGLDASGVGTGVAKAKAHITGMEAAMGLAGLAIVGVAAKSVQAAMEWESSFAGVKKTLDTTGLSVEQETAAFAELEGALRSMALEIPIGVNELAALAEAGGALGIAREDLTEFVRVAAILGETTDLEAGRAAEALGKIGAIIPFTRDEYALFGDVLVDLGNDGASTESAIMDMAQNFAGTASLIGLSKTEMLGWSAAMANVAEGAEAGGSSLSRIFTNVDKAVATTSPKLAGMAEIAGMNADAFAEMYKNDPSGTLEKVVGGLAGMESGARYAAYELLGISDIRVKRAMDKLVAGFSGDRGLTPTLERAALAAQTTGAMMTEAEKRFATTEAQMDLLKNAFNETAITLGTVLLPYVLEIITHVKNGVVAFADWMDQNKELVATLTPIVTVLGGLIALNFGAKMLMTLLPLKGAAQLISGELMKGVPAAEQAGTMMGKAHGAAMGAALVIGVAAAAAVVAPVLDAWAKDMNAQIFGNPAELEAQGGKFAGTVVDSIGDGLHEAVRQGERLVIWDFETDRGLFIRGDPAAAGTEVGEEFIGGAAHGVRVNTPGFISEVDRVGDQVQETFGDGGLGAGGSWSKSAAEGIRASGPLITSHMQNVIANAAKALAKSQAIDEAAVELQNKLRMHVSEIASTLEGLGEAGEDGMKALRQSFKSEDLGESMEQSKERLRDLRRFYTRNLDAMGPETLASWTAMYTTEKDKLDAMTFYAENKSAIIGGAVPEELWEGMPDTQRALISMLNMHQGKFGLMSDTAKGGAKDSAVAIPNAWDDLRYRALAAVRETTDSARAIVTNTRGYHTGGVNAANAWVGGMISGISSGAGRFHAALSVYSSMTAGASPPPEGPLKDIDKGGFNVGMAWTDNVIAAIDRGGPLLKGRLQRMRDDMADVVRDIEAGGRRAERALAGARASAAEAAKLVGSGDRGGKVRAEDGSMVAKSFYTNNPPIFDWWKAYRDKGGDQQYLAYRDRIKRQAASIGQTLSDYLRTRSPAKKGPLSEGGGPGGWMATMGSDMVHNLEGQLGGMRHASALVAEALTPSFTAPDIGSLAAPYAGPTSGSSTMTVRHEFGPITVNGNVSPEAGREIGRGIGEGMDLEGVMRHLGQMRGRPMEPVR